MTRPHAARLAQNGKVVIDPASTTSTASKVRAGRKARSTVRARWAARSSSSRMQPDLEATSAPMPMAAARYRRRRLQPHRERDAEPAAGRRASPRCASSARTRTSAAGSIATSINSFPLEVNNSTQRGDVAAAPVTQRFSRSELGNACEAGRAALLVKPTDALSSRPRASSYQSIHQGGPNTIDVPPGNDGALPALRRRGAVRGQFQSLHLRRRSTTSTASRSSPATADWTRHQLQTAGHLRGDAGLHRRLPRAAGRLPLLDGGRRPGRRHDLRRRLLPAGERGTARRLHRQRSVAMARRRLLQHLSRRPRTCTPTTTDSRRCSVPTTWPTIIAVSNIDQYALFGETSYEMPNHLKSTVGLTLLHVPQRLGDLASAAYRRTARAPRSTRNAQNSGVTPKVNLAYIPDDNTTVYGRSAKGFRPGGPNSPIPPPCTPRPTQFGPDSVWSYELGEKLRLAESRVSVNGAVYYEDWSNIQQQVAPPAAISSPTNAGKAKVYGAELEVAVIPGDRTDAHGKRRLHPRDELHHAARGRRRLRRPPARRSEGHRQYDRHLPLPAALSATHEPGRAGSPTATWTRFRTSLTAATHCPPTTWSTRGSASRPITGRRCSSSTT